MASALGCKVPLSSIDTEMRSTPASDGGLDPPSLYPAQELKITLSKTND